MEMAEAHPPCPHHSWARQHNTWHSWGSCSDPRRSSPLCYRKCRPLWKGKRKGSVSSEEATKTQPLLAPKSTPAHLPGQPVPVFCLGPTCFSVSLPFYFPILIFFLLSSTSKMLLPHLLFFRVAHPPHLCVRHFSPQKHHLSHRGLYQDAQF